jgi:hypothetical protein
MEPLHADKITQLQDSVEKLTMCFVTLLGVCYKDSMPCPPEQSKNLPQYSGTGNPNVEQDIQKILQETKTSKENIFELIDSIKGISNETTEYDSYVNTLTESYTRIKSLSGELERQLEHVDNALTFIAEDLLQG